MNYIICSGGLGNQMFQYAFYYINRKKKNVAFDISMFADQKIHNGYELKKCFGITDFVNVYSNTHGFNRVLYKIASHFQIKSLGRIKNEIINNYIDEIKWDNSIIYGYWQSAEFFDDYKKDIKELYTFKNISLKNIQLAKKIQQEESVSIHIRRGDYLTASHYYSLCETNYYKNCIKYLNKHFNHLSYYIFSDDVDWCRRSGFFPDTAIYVDWNNGENSYEDLFLMLFSKYCVIANSTFSWWAAYLGNHQVVLRPSVYKDDWDLKKINSFFHKDWIEIKV